MKTIERNLISTPTTLWNVQRVIALDWYDGPRSGVCWLASPACQLYFELHAEQWNEGKLGSRLYRLSVMRNGDFEIVEELFAAHGDEQRPLWSPHGDLPEAELQHIDLVLAEISARKESTRLIVRSEDMLTIEELWLLTHDGGGPP